MTATDDWSFWMPDADDSPQITPEPESVRPTPARLTVGSRRITITGGYRYTGVVKHDGRKLVECGHEHNNRDCSYPSSGVSATDCARSIIQGARIPATAELTAGRLQNRWQSLASAAGHSYPASVIEAAKADAEAAARSYLAAVDAVREVIA